MNKKHQEIINTMENNLISDTFDKKIKAIFYNERYFKRLDYKPYFQRHYVWDTSKASYFIESIILGTEIPPLVLFDNGKVNEIIDGRQRFETIYRFLNDKLTLNGNELSILSELQGKVFSDLEESIQDRFLTTTIRIFNYKVANEPEISETNEDLVKKEIFRRYNSGITSLKKEEISRAEYINDEFTIAFQNQLKKNDDLLLRYSTLFLRRSDINKNKRDRINIICNEIRNVIAISIVPINVYSVSVRQTLLREYYYKYTSLYLDTFDKTNALIKKINKVSTILNNFQNKLYDNNIISIRILSQTFLWVFLSQYDNILRIYNYEMYSELINYIIDKEYIYQVTDSHYYMNVIERYSYSASFFNKHNISFKNSLNGTRDKREFKTNDHISFKWHDNVIREKSHLVSIDDICTDINDNKFLIRPTYQRSEAISVSKASALLESIMLGIKIPPIFVYKREDKISEVIDGQQRLLSIIGFLGKSYINEEGIIKKSQNDKFSFKNLKILEKLNTKNEYDLKNEYERLYNSILDYQLEIIEIDYSDNPNFDPIDLFLRLNSKPYPIKDNSFEMWNAFADKELILEIRKMKDNSEYSWFFKNDVKKRMINEELITSLAYLFYISDYTDKKIASCLTIYIRSERLSLRITSKLNITKILDLCSYDNSVKENFIKSISKVKNLIMQLDVLLDCENKSSKMAELFDNKNTRTKDLDYYILWYVLNRFSKTNIIREHRRNLYTDINQLYIKLKGEMLKTDKEMCIEEMNQVVKKFGVYSNMA